MPREGDGKATAASALSESFSRAATAKDLKDLIAALNDNGVEYLLIGGYALQAHGY